MDDYFELLKSHWFAICLSKQVNKKPFPFTLLETPLVLFRNEGKIACLLDRCSHRGVPLSKGKIVNNCIQCPYHGWSFDSTGECQRIPGLLNKEPQHSSRKIHNFPVMEKWGLVWVCLREEQHQIYQPEFIENKNYDSFFSHININGEMVNIIENFLDATHTHFVHSGLIRHDGTRQKIKAIIRQKGNCVEAQYSEEGKQSGWISKIFERERLDSFGRFTMPSVAELEYRSPKATSILITIYITPMTSQKHSVYVVVSIKKGWIPKFAKKIILAPFLKKALRQDLDIIEIQRQNLSRFPQQKFISTELDVIRPHVIQLLQGKAIEGKERVVEMLV